VAESQQHRHAQRKRHAQRPGPVPFSQRQHEQHPVERNHRADRQVNATGDDDSPAPDAEDAEQADQIGGVGKVGLRKEGVVFQPGGDTEDDEQDKNPNSFLVTSVFTSEGRDNSGGAARLKQVSGFP